MQFVSNKASVCFEEH